MGNAEEEHPAKQRKREIIVRREAQLEAREAFDHYEEISEGLGFEFMRSLDAAIQFVKRNPLAYQKCIKMCAAFYFVNFLTRFFTFWKKIELS